MGIADLVTDLTGDSETVGVGVEKSSEPAAPGNRPMMDLLFEAIKNVDLRRPIRAETLVDGLQVVRSVDVNPNRLAGVLGIVVQCEGVPRLVQTRCNGKRHFIARLGRRWRELEPPRHGLSLLSLTQFADWTFLDVKGMHSRLAGLWRPGSIRPAVPGQCDVECLTQGTATGGVANLISERARDGDLIGPGVGPYAI